MNFLMRLFTVFSRYAKRTGICINTGIIAGAIAGLSLSLLDLMHGGIALTVKEAFVMALLLTGFTWLVILFFLCFLARLTFASVALPALLNCLLTCMATVFVTRLLNAYFVGWFIGIVIGMIIGSLLCRLNDLIQKLKG